VSAKDAKYSQIESALIHVSKIHGILKVWEKYLFVWYCFIKNICRP
jgi:hypothetical protein